MRLHIAEELSRNKSQYGDRRRTQIIKTTKGKRARPILTATDLAPTKETWVVISRDNLIWRTPTARLPRLSGRNAPRLIIGANARDTLYLFGARGSAVAVAVHTLPEGNSSMEGILVNAATPFDPETEIVAGIALPLEKTEKNTDKGFLILGTVNGMIKKTSLHVFPGPSAKAFQAIKIADTDVLGWIHLTSGKDDICLITSMGMAIRFPETDVRHMGLAASGVRGIRLDDPQSRVVGMGLVVPTGDLLLLTEDGLAKRSALNKFPRQGRHGKGVLAWKSGEDVRLVGAAIGHSSNRVVVHLARGAARSVRFSDAPKRARAAIGSKLFELKPGNQVTHLTPVISRPTLNRKKSSA